MVKVQFSLPDQLAEEAQSAGLLSSDRLELWVREQLKQQRAAELFTASDRMAATTDPSAMSPEEVAQELAAMRAERRANHAN